MRISLLLLFCAVLCGQKVFGDEEIEVKRGAFPFMAFVYYPDGMISAVGLRFTRNAILIHPQWLISSLIDVDNGNTTFPQKTLLARAGAIVIDADIALNEDEGEQEREIVQIVRPGNPSISQWWHNDISLLKTLLPFNNSDSVAPTSLPDKTDIVGDKCSILIYAAQHDKTSGFRILKQLFVQLLATSEETCGSYFRKGSMVCGSLLIGSKTPDDLKFCVGNNGGPLICDGKVIGIQTYVTNDCNEPYLYQLVSAWEELISCSKEEKCHEEKCKGVCSVTDKDPQRTSLQTPTTAATVLFTTDTVITHTTEEVISSVVTEEALKSDTPEISSESEEKEPTLGEIEANSAEISTLENIEITNSTSERLNAERERKINVEAKKLESVDGTKSIGSHNIFSLCYLASVLTLVYFIY